MGPSIACNLGAESKKDARFRLLALRSALVSEPAQNARRTALEARLGALVEPRAPRCIGFYWPLPGEFDARPFVAAWLAADPARRAALPAIRAAAGPLEFRAWTSDTPMREGRHRIPEPAADAPLAQPDLLLIPCVGFDADGYRLGYGGGYYDRTLAAWPGEAWPATIGVAWDACRLDALLREPHDLPLDAVLTEAGAYGRGA